MGSVVVVALLAGGCSVIAVRGPRTTPTREVVCEATWIPPAIDTAIAVVGMALIAWASTDKDTGETDQHAVTDREAAIYPGVAFAVPFGISALYGYSKVGACKRAASESHVARASRN